MAFCNLAKIVENVLVMPFEGLKEVNESLTIEDVAAVFKEAEEETKAFVQKVLSIAEKRFEITLPREEESGSLSLCMKEDEPLELLSRTARCCGSREEIERAMSVTTNVLFDKTIWQNGKISLVKLTKMFGLTKTQHRTALKMAKLLIGNGELVREACWLLSPRDCIRYLLCGFGNVVKARALSTKLGEVIEALVLLSRVAATSNHDLFAVMGGKIASRHSNSSLMASVDLATNLNFNEEMPTTREWITALKEQYQAESSAIGEVKELFSTCLKTTAKGQRCRLKCTGSTCHKHTKGFECDGKFIGALGCASDDAVTDVVDACGVEDEKSRKRRRVTKAKKSENMSCESTPKVALCRSRGREPRPKKERVKKGRQVTVEDIEAPAAIVDEGLPNIPVASPGPRVHQECLVNETLSASSLDVCCFDFDSMNNSLFTESEFHPEFMEQRVEKTSPGSSSGDDEMNVSPMETYNQLLEIIARTKSDAMWAEQPTRHRVELDKLKDNIDAVMLSKTASERLALTSEISKSLEFLLKNDVITFF